MGRRVDNGPVSGRFTDDGREPEADDQQTLSVDRRGFLGGAAAVAGAAAIEVITHDPLYARASSALAASPTAQNPSFSIDIHRREDFLFLRADGYYLDRRGQYLYPRGRAFGILVITFVPQHVIEQAYEEGARPDRPGRIHALVAAASRLAFVVTRAGIPLTLEGLLSWGQLNPALVPAAAQAESAQVRRLARPAGSSSRGQRRGHHRPSAAAVRHHEARALAAGFAPPLREPYPDETALELPWHLVLSPTADGQWSHETEPVTLGGATEIWRTQLTTPEGQAATAGGAVRAVWNYDVVEGTDTPTLEGGTPQANEEPFRASLTAFDRYQIVKASGDFTTRGRADIPASRLILSARGGTLSAEASWDTSLQISAWSHDATQGRDQYVKVVNKGFLFPFGHPVSLVTVTQREFDELESQTVGILRQTIHLVVAQPTVSYDPAVNPVVANNGRDFPFRSIQLTNAGTATLDPVVPFVSDGNDPDSTDNPTPFVPTVNGQPVSWNLIGTDWSGRATGFVAQGVFVSYADGTDAYRMGLVRDAYNALASDNPLRTTDFGGKTLTFAESNMPGDTDLPTFAMTFAASPGQSLPQSQLQSADVAGFVPTLVSELNGQPTGAQASVSLPAAEQASGAPLNNNGRPTLAYYAAFVENGFYSAAATANQGNVFMEMLGDASSLPNLTFNGKNAGGVLTPNMQLQGLSRSLGPVGDLDNIYNGTFSPSKIFQSLEGPLAARILGGVTLADLLADAKLLEAPTDTPDAPNLEALRVTATRSGDVSTTTVTWSPKINGGLSGVPTVITARPDKASDGTPMYPLKFTLNCVITTDLTQPLNSSYTIHGELDNFIVNLVSTGDDQFISIIFSSFSFDSVSGGKPKIKPKVAGVNFDGALQFVAELASFIGLDGGGGPDISDVGDAISAALSIKLPDIDVGILSLSHVAIDTGFNLPFDGGPSLFNFGFASPDNPFALAIGIFGGGGFFNLSLGTVGVKEIAGSFEFGAMAALDIGVASGAVSVQAGFYFMFALDITKTPAQETCVLSGFVKLNGNLSVLDIITLSLEFDLTLTYLSSPGEITGTATLVISVSLLYFSKTVTLTASKTFVNPHSGGQVSAHARRSGHDQAQIVANTPQGFGDQMTQSDWNTYCGAFAPVS